MDNMNRIQLFEIADQIKQFMSCVDCYSVRGDGKSTIDCDIAIDSYVADQFNSQDIPTGVSSMWVESVSYDSSLYRYKFIVA